MRIKNLVTLFTIAFFVCLIAAPSFAQSYRSRNQADSDYRIAEKTYRKIVKNYGDSLEGLPEQERVTACKRINSALYTNRHNMVAEDMFRQNKLKKQIRKLRQYSTELGCPNTK
jgi:cbb3-type cytochrome oxidase subunit 3